MKTNLTFFLIICSLKVSAQFVVQDIQIGNTTASYLDFEF